MNSVSLVGQLAEEPQFRENRGDIPECRMRIAVSRHARTGRHEPGVVYLDVTTFGEEARECASRLKLGSRIALVGRIDTDEGRAGSGEWEVRQQVLIDQLDFL